MPVGLPTAAPAVVHELIDARNDYGLINLQQQLARLGLLIINEHVFLPLGTEGAELLFEVLAKRLDRGSVLVTSNLLFDA